MLVGKGSIIQMGNKYCLASSAKGKNVRHLSTEAAAARLNMHYEHKDIMPNALPYRHGIH